MVQVNQEVLTKKGERGIVSAIITKSTGYVEVTLESGRKVKEMAFNLTDKDGNTLKKKPAKKVVEKKMEDPVQTWKNIALSVNDRWNQNSLYKLAVSSFDKIRQGKDQFIDSLLDSFFNKGRLSEKQAYYLAKYYVEHYER